MSLLETGGNSHQDGLIATPGSISPIFFCHWGIIGWDHHCPWMNKCIGPMGSTFRQNRAWPTERHSWIILFIEISSVTKSRWGWFFPIIYFWLIDPRWRQPVLLQLLPWYQLELLRLHRPGHNVGLLTPVLCHAKSPHHHLDDTLQHLTAPRKA